MLNDVVNSQQKSLRLKKKDGYTFDQIESLRTMANRYSAGLVFGGHLEEHDSIYVCFDDKREVEIPRTGLFALLKTRKYYSSIESKMGAFLTEYSKSDISSEFPLG